jgi:proteasome lid subunit RPN8/RPN11
MENTAVLRLDRGYADEIIAHAREEAPNECCGIIAGQDGRPVKLFRAVNAEASPYRYEVESNDLYRFHKEIEDSGWDVLAIYHSHIEAEAYPSPTDVRLAAWPEAYYLIVSLADQVSPVLRAFRIRDGQVSEEELAIVDPA